MGKETVLKPAMRVIVESILDMQEGEEKKWSQRENDAAVAIAAAEYDGKANGPDGKPLGARGFLTTYACHGFPSNASQFSQALARLPKSDACHVIRSEERLNDYL